MTINDFIIKFEESYPTSYAFDGDNVGLLVGDRNDEIAKVLVTCDVDLGVVEEAVNIGANKIAIRNKKPVTTDARPVLAPAPTPAELST